MMGSMTTGPEPRRLYKEPEEKKVAGVCGGLADYLGLDPTIVRLAVVLLAVSTWFGIALYVIAACVIPKRPDDVPRHRSDQQMLPEGTTTPVILVLLVLAGLALVYQRAWLHAPTIGLLLLGLGIWLFVADRDAPPRKATSNATTGSAGATTLMAGETTAEMDLAPRVPSAVPDDSALSAGPQGEVPPPVPPWGVGSHGDIEPMPAPPAEHRRTGPLDPTRGSIVALLCLGAGIVALLTALDVLSLGFSTTVAGGLVVIGAAMVYGGIRGRARWLIGLGVPAIGLLILDDLATVPIDAGIGDRTVLVAEDGVATDRHELSMGSLTLDLRHVEGDRFDPPDITGKVGLGELQVLLPPDMTARVEAHVGAGNITADDFAEDEDGIDLERTFTVDREEDTPEGKGRLVNLDLRVDVGEIEVSHG